MRTYFFKFTIITLMLTAITFTGCNKKNKEDPLDLGSICDGGLYIYRSGWFMHYDSEKEFIGDFLMGDWLFVAFNLQAQDVEIVTFVNDVGFFEPIDARKVIRPKTSHLLILRNKKHALS